MPNSDTFRVGNGVNALARSTSHVKACGAVPMRDRRYRNLINRTAQAQKRFSHPRPLLSMERRSGCTRTEATRKTDQFLPSSPFRS